MVSAPASQQDCTVAFTGESRTVKECMPKSSQNHHRPTKPAHIAAPGFSR
ncbi:hypothetical protein FMN52_17055 [Marinobacter sp. BW6]|nr:hypothetical protein FMN52_17055 [Marinobacter sp. BW6]